MVVICEIASLFFTVLLILFSIPAVITVVRLENASDKSLVWLSLWGVVGIASSGFRLAAMFLSLHEVTYRTRDWFMPSVVLLIGCSAIALHFFVHKVIHRSVPNADGFSVTTPSPTDKTA